MNIYDQSEPRYVISVAARMVGVHVQTLRYYERAGLVKPSRSEGNTRFYSTRDVQATASSPWGKAKTATSWMSSACASRTWSS